MSTATASKERPIIFNADEVRAVLDGRKSATRRVVKEPDLTNFICDGEPPTIEDKYGEHHPATDWCPYGRRGDRLWIRETWWHHKECRPPFEHQRESCVRYDATEPPERRDWLSEQYTRRSPVHMPRWASRITLEITDVAVERLQDISEDEARAEGVEAYFDDGVWYYGPYNRGHADPRAAFARLWDSRHKPPHDWASSPWAWIVRFRRVEP